MDVYSSVNLFPFLLNAQGEKKIKPITCDTFSFFKSDPLMKDTIDLLEIVFFFFMLESRTHHFEYAQSGKEGRVPMDVATLRILR